MSLKLGFIMLLENIYFFILYLINIFNDLKSFSQNDFNHIICIKLYCYVNLGITKYPLAESFFFQSKIKMANLSNNLSKKMSFFCLFYSSYL